MLMCLGLDDLDLVQWQWCVASRVRDNRLREVKIIYTCGNSPQETPLTMKTFRTIEK